MSRIHPYIHENQRNRDIFVQALANANHCQVHRSTNATHFNQLLSRHPLEPTTFASLSDLASDLTTVTNPKDLQEMILYHVPVMYEKVSNTLTHRQAK